MSADNNNLVFNPSIGTLYYNITLYNYVIVSGANALSATTIKYSNITNSTITYNDTTGRNNVGINAYYYEIVAVNSNGSSQVATSALYSNDPNPPTALHL